MQGLLKFIKFESFYLALFNPMDINHPLSICVAAREKTQFLLKLKDEVSWWISQSILPANFELTFTR
jgi:hypothetical protein